MLPGSTLTQQAPDRLGTPLSRHIRLWFNGQDQQNEGLVNDITHASRRSRLEDGTPP
jgi:hypothetical protein